MTNRDSKNLIHKGKYDDSFTSILIEQYKMYVQTADNISARRVTTGRYLLTLNAALIAVYGFQTSIFSQWYLTLVVSITGVVVSLIWYRIIKSHSDLNSKKFEIIQKLEEHLPAALFTEEWKIVEKGKDKAYTKITDIERWIPFLFIGLHVVLSIVMLLPIHNA